MEDEEQEEVERIQVWVSRLQAFAESLDDLEGTTPTDFCENAINAWQNTVMSDSPPPASPAMLVIIQVMGAMTQIMKNVALDWVDTADVRDRLTRDSTQQLLNDALAVIVSDSNRWLSEGLPSADAVQGRMSAARENVQAAIGELQERDAELEQAEAEAAADPFGAVLGYRDDNHPDVGLILDKVCSFSEAEHAHYRDAHERLRKMLDRELLRHISDESDAVIDAVTRIFQDLQGDRISLMDEDAWDERRRKLRSALISFTTALQIHEDQTIRAARDAFGRKMPKEQAVLALFNDLKTTSFEYRWLGEMRDALLHGDINAFKYEFGASVHSEPTVNVYMDRRYMLGFTKESRNKPWVKRSELQQMTSDPSVLDMIKSLQPELGKLQDKLDAILYPNVTDDVATVRELIGRFEGRHGMYALQNGPGFTRRTGIPPLHRLAPRVLTFAETHQQADS
ncbi:hypothetical protein A5692_13290 [Mycobacterium sp. E342]|uniref:VWA domain-containing protein n=1 Tax=Mycobacterium sp. E342 TaxID=1834147 RepID=UPI000801EDFC|nr:VWA domain-containing protein [Mycobacterium sp. E342]OBH34273.1 hypothetical protein A5692_13290 [Mycobacterium sp. E342]